MSIRISFGPHVSVLKKRVPISIPGQLGSSAHPCPLSQPHNDTASQPTHPVSYTSNPRNIDAHIPKIFLPHEKKINILFSRKKQGEEKKKHTGTNPTPTLPTVEPLLAPNLVLVLGTLREKGSAYRTILGHRWICASTIPLRLPKEKLGESLFGVAGGILASINPY